MGGYSRQLDTFFIKLQVNGYSRYSIGGGGGILLAAGYILH